ncbi:MULTISPECIES: alpha-xenorhabdolysin family binary toxin subunit A [unclassified Pseudomonas]|uniref:alpha-xenorhabdolysin family binary toxin subunit A n=1 Tax=unclassified Pseudomonas TaxID=196821 RepID=UPI000CD068F4|nr:MULTISPECIES: alpha-xenorhabdolysin family binary toxin subunit A [unclassified Pseudomonas]POA32408.1 hypothetical protein C1887_10295 [Pseudomonas sp. GW456-R21]POA68948.1 hypothetical protein C1884_08805 [Pseudomonas sp. GW460-R15]
MSSTIEFAPTQTKITADDINQVQRYVRKGLSLPTTIERVNNEFKGSVEDSGISPPDLLTTFTNIHGHASEWAYLETSIIKTAGTLKRFSTDLEDYTKPAIDEIKTIKGYEDYAFETKDLTEEQVRIFKVPVDTRDPSVDDTYATINEYALSIIDSIQQKQNEATAIKNQLLNFDQTLIQIEQDVGAKAAKALGSNTLQELRDITAKLIANNNALSDLQKKSERVWWDVVCWFAIFPYLVAKSIAQIVRDDQMEALRNENDKLLEKQATLQKTAAVLNAIQSEMRSLSIFTRGAIEGMKQIETVWNATLNEVIASKNLLANPKDLSVLRIFIIKMTAVLERWKKINNYMNSVTTAFSS